MEEVTITDRLVKAVEEYKKVKEFLALARSYKLSPYISVYDGPSDDYGHQSRYSSVLTNFVRRQLNEIIMTGIRDAELEVLRTQNELSKFIKV